MAFLLWASVKSRQGGVNPWDILTWERCSHLQRHFLRWTGSYSRLQQWLYDLPGTRAWRWGKAVSWSLSFKAGKQRSPGQGEGSSDTSELVAAYCKEVRCWSLRSFRKREKQEEDLRLRAKDYSQHSEWADRERPSGQLEDTESGHFCWEADVQMSLNEGMGHRHVCVVYSHVWVHTDKKPWLSESRWENASEQMNLRDQEGGKTQKWTRGLPRVNLRCHHFACEVIEVEDSELEETQKAASLK